jgi:three-Cys-motif partner protein
VTYAIVTVKLLRDRMTSLDFFHSKKPWSPYKDMILSYYLTPYLPKVCTLGRPVVVFDCFAGPGRFEDGTDGSPLIIAKAVRRIAYKRKPVSAVFIEEKRKYFQRLQESVKGYQDICRTRHGSFEDTAKEIADMGRKNTVFVYVDPYGIKPLRFETLAGIYANIARGSSVEVLLNFNASSLVRNGLAALKCRQPKKTGEDNDLVQEEEVDRTMTPEDLDLIAGGKFWREIVTSDLSFADKEEQCVSEYIRLMKRFFDEVCSYGIKEKYEHTVPKYRLLVGSRHEDAFILMNDAICNARDEFLGKQRVNGYLFDMRAVDEIHDPQRLRMVIMDSLKTPMTRKDLIVRAMHRVFAEYKQSEHKRMVGSLIGEGHICSKSGKTRINDNEVLSPSTPVPGRHPQ